MRDGEIFDGKLLRMKKKLQNERKKLFTSSSTFALLPFSVESSLAGACARAWLFAWICVVSERVLCAGGEREKEREERGLLFESIV